MLFVLFGPLAREMGLTENQFGLVFTLSNIPLIFAGPFWGRKSDEVGRKPILLIGLAGTCVGTLALAFAIQVGLWKLLPIWALLLLLFAARTVYSLTATAVYPSSGAYMADITSREDRAKGMALIGAANSSGAILGPVLGGSLAFIYVLFPMYLASAIALIGGIAIYFLLPEPAKHSNRSGAPALRPNDPRIVPFMIMWVAFFLVFTTLQFITAFYIQDRLSIDDPQEVIKIAAMCMGTLAVVNVSIQLIVLQFFKIHPRYMLRFCFPMFVIALLIIAFATTLPALLLGYMFLGFGFSVANPGINGGASLSVEPHEQGAASGMLAGATTVGVVIGPLLGTFLYSYQINLPMFFGAGLLAIMAVYAFMIKVPDPKPYIHPSKGQESEDR